MATDELTGSCHCGAVRYRARKPWLAFVHCHCSRCRKATGISHATNLFAELGKVEFTLGAEKVRRYDLPTAERFATSFCGDCGGPVPRLTRNRSGWVIPAGSLDEAPDITPRARIFWGSRAPWTCDGDELPTHEAGLE